MISSVCDSAAFANDDSIYKSKTTKTNAVLKNEVRFKFY